MLSIEVPEGRIAQVAFAFRAKANEFHGAVAREPDADVAAEWRATAEWFDAQADFLRDTRPNSMVR